MDDTAKLKTLLGIIERRRDLHLSLEKGCSKRSRGKTEDAKYNAKWEDIYQTSKWEDEHILEEYQNKLQEGRGGKGE